VRWCYPTILFPFLILNNSSLVSRYYRYVIDSFSTETALNLGTLLLETNDLLNANSRLDRNHDTVLATTPGLADLLSKPIRISGKVHVRLLDTTFVHKGEFISLNIDDLPVRLVDNGNSSSVRGGNHIFELLSGKDIGGEKVTLGVSVLSSLGDGNLENLARLSLDHHVSVRNKIDEWDGV